jgi:hypothetical protein
MVALNKPKEEINGLGYDRFIGREIFEDGDENFVTLNLHSMGSGSYLSLEQACDDLCSGIESGERVLLYQSPGQVGFKTRRAPHIFEALNSALADTMREGDAAMVVDQGQGEETYTLAGRRYEPFEPEQMTLLQKMYQDKEKMKRFPNPFDAQPLIH